MTTLVAKVYFHFNVSNVIKVADMSTCMLFLAMYTFVIVTMRLRGLELIDTNKHRPAGPAGRDTTHLGNHVTFLNLYIDIAALAVCVNSKNGWTTKKRRFVSSWQYQSNNNNNNIFILYSAKSMYSSKRFTIKRCDIASLKLIRNVKCAINIQYSG